MTAWRKELRLLRKQAREFYARMGRNDYVQPHIYRRIRTLEGKIEQHDKAAKARKRYGASAKMPRVSAAAMRQLWRAAFDEAAPKNLRVEWCVKPEGRALGYAHYRTGLIRMAWERYDPKSKLRGTRHWYGDLTTGEYCVLGVLIHEFVHLRSGENFKHGTEFRRIETAAQRDAGIPDNPWRYYTKAEMEECKP